MPERVCGCGKICRGNRFKCNTCSVRDYRSRNQLRYTYQTLRMHARERKIPFDLTLVEWEIWCGLTGYLELRGTKATDLTVDRINADAKKGYWGYSYANMQALTKEANSRKRQVMKERRWAVVPRGPDDVF